MLQANGLGTVLLPLVCSVFMKAPTDNDTNGIIKQSTASDSRLLAPPPPPSFPFTQTPPPHHTHRGCGPIGGGGGRTH